MFVTNSSQHLQNIGTDLVPGDYRLTEGVSRTKVLNISVVRALTLNSDLTYLTKVAGEITAVSHQR